jgi:AraC-like DNA-binding protein
MVRNRGDGSTTWENLREASNPVEFAPLPRAAAAIGSRHRHGFTMPWRRDSWHKLLLVAAGHGALELPRTRAAIHTGTVAWVPAGQRHRLEDADEAPMTVFVIGIDRRAMPMPDWPAGAVLPSANGYVRASLLRLIRRLMAETAMPGSLSVQMSAGLAGQLLATVARAMAAVPAPSRSVGSGAAGQVTDTVAECLAWLQTRPPEIVPVTDLAQLAGLGERQFSDRFRALTGSTPHAWQQRRRLEHAAARLRRSGDILLTAIEGGFEDLSHFTRAFKRHFRTTPRAWLDASAVD